MRHPTREPEFTGDPFPPAHFFHFGPARAVANHHIDQFRVTPQRSLR